MRSQARHLASLGNFALALALSACSASGRAGPGPPRAVGYAAMGATTAAAAATSALKLRKLPPPEPKKIAEPKAAETTESDPVGDFRVCPEGAGRFRIRCLSKGDRRWCYYETDDGDGISCHPDDCSGPLTPALLKWCRERK